MSDKQTEAPWMISETLELDDGAEILMKDGQEIVAAPRALQGRYDPVVSVMNSARVGLRGLGSIIGNGATGDSEWRHCLALNSCGPNVCAELLTLSNSGGDGIYVGARGERKWCEDVTIRRCRVTRAHRNGLSLISGRRIRVKDCYFSGAKGTRPKAGICVEPNESRECVEDVRFDSCICEANDGAGIMLNLTKLSPSSSPVDVVFANCEVTSGIEPAIRIYTGDCNGTIVFQNCEFRGTQLPGLHLVSKGSTRLGMSFLNCLWSDVARNPNYLPFQFDITHPVGPRVTFSNCRIIERAETSRPFIVAPDDVFPSVYGRLIVPTGSLSNSIRTKFPKLTVVEK